MHMGSYTLPASRIVSVRLAGDRLRDGRRRFPSSIFLSAFTRSDCDMRQQLDPLVPWTKTSLAVALAIAAVSKAAAVALSEKGLWPGFTGSELLVSAVAGGAVLWFIHRKSVGMILFVFIPLTVILLFLGTFVFAILFGRVDL